MKRILFYLVFVSIGFSASAAELALKFGDREFTIEELQISKKGSNGCMATAPNRKKIQKAADELRLALIKRFVPESERTLSSSERASLQSPKCREIFSHYPEQAEDSAKYFKINRYLHEIYNGRTYWVDYVVAAPWTVEGWNNLILRAQEEKFLEIRDEALGESVLKYVAYNFLLSPRTNLGFPDSPRCGKLDAITSRDRPPK